MIGDLRLRPEAEQLLSEYPAPPPAKTATTTAAARKNPSALFQKTDVTSWPHLSALMGRADAAFPRVDIVVAGAGVFEPAASGFWEPPATATSGPTRSGDDAAGEPGGYLSLDANLVHPIRLGQLAVGRWTTRRERGGTLLCVSSAAGHMAGIGSPLYFASKHGLHGFVRSLGSLRDEAGIRVAAVAPGTVRTPMWSDDPDKKGMTGEQDVTIEPEEIAEGMLELCENPEYGDGTILEVLKGTRRVVPLYGNTPPTGLGLMVSGYAKMQSDLYHKLKTDGLKV